MDRSAGCPGTRFAEGILSYYHVDILSSQTYHQQGAQANVGALA